MSVSQPADASVSSGKRDLFGHPPGLTVLFLTQTWAEFSYFGLQAMLVLYMTQQLALPQADSSIIYGLYTGCAFFSPFIGGIIADRWLGKTPSVVIGGVLMMLGHFAMAFEQALFPALALVAIGNGLFLPPLAVQISALYREGDARRDQAFSAYYMGINLGAFTAIILCPLLAQLYGWHWGFAAAGFGMALGLIIYLGFKKHLPPEPPRVAIEATKRTPLAQSDWKALSTLVGLIAVVILFRIAYEQSGNTITLWLNDRTERSLGGWDIPAPWFTSLNPLLIIVLTPFLMVYWRKRKAAGQEPNLFRRMAIGCALAGLACLIMVAAAYDYAASAAPVSALWVITYFVLLTLGELLVLPIGLALIGRLSPVQVASMMMGAWYIAKFVGSVSAGFIGTLWLTIPTELFFAIGAGSTFLAALILFWMGRPQPGVTAS
ncbi:di-/tripeptide transporter [alpha proteobacterium U9-1i]|nr:di-/tripeptide transporter [alpha proteobacterium U9-1i]